MSRAWRKSSFPAAGGLPVFWGSWRRWFYGLGILAGLFLLGGCRSLSGPGSLQPDGVSGRMAGLAAEAFGPPRDWPGLAPVPGPMVQDPATGQGGAAPAPLVAYGPWRPPGIAPPWPEDEYLKDGGDRGVAVQVAAQGQLQGVEVEDTVAHYTSLDGQWHVEPSNRVHIYSPRFASVRQVCNLVASEGRKGWANLYQPTQLFSQQVSRSAVWHKQHFSLGRYQGQDLPLLYFGRLGRDVVSAALGPESFRDRFLPFEDFQIIRTGQMEESEKAELARRVEAAVVWAKDDTLGVILNAERAAAVARDDGLLQFYVVKTPPANPKLRLVKVASTAYAEPGDVIEFTLRFDNVGNQAIGNVVILDNLSSRLEYLADSAQCSLKAFFTAEPNEAGAVLLRWELAEPLQPGEGGIIRFRCRVR